mgnify:CR=1 FL=1
MHLTLFLRGLAIGFSIAAPVGPIGVLCIRRTLADGRAFGLASGLGAATADAIFGCIAGFGLTFASTFLVNQQKWLKLLGGAFLCYLGLKTLLAKVEDWPGVAKGKGLVHAYASTFFLTLANPMTIISFAAVFSSLGMAAPAASYSSAGTLAVRVSLGSALWWLVLSVGVGALRKKLAPSGLRLVNRIAGAVILGFGVWALVAALWS